MLVCFVHKQKLTAHIFFHQVSKNLYPTKEFEGGIGSLFDLCVNALRWRTFWRSHMEVSYCTSGFGAIISIRFTFAEYLLHNNLNARMM